jgi:TetR/AcrR family acrAB operon transcriptional repressor
MLQGAADPSAPDMAKRTKEEAEQTRSAVLTAASKVFLERGVARATLEEVAQAAGVTRGAVYWHFRDKLDLFLAISERARMPYEGRLTDLVARLEADPSLDPFAEFEKTIEAGFLALEANAERQRLLTILMLRCEYVEEMAPAIERQRRARALFRAELEQTCALIAARGRLAAPWRPEAAADALYLVLVALLQESLQTPEKARLTVQGMVLVRVFLSALDAARSRDAARAPDALPRAAAG